MAGRGPGHRSHPSSFSSLAERAEPAPPWPWVSSRGPTQGVRPEGGWECSVSSLCQSGLSVLRPLCMCSEPHGGLSQCQPGEKLRHRALCTLCTKETQLEEGHSQCAGPGLHASPRQGSHSLPGLWDLGFGSGCGCIYILALVLLFIFCLFIYFAFGPELAVPRDDSWLCAPGSFLVVLGTVPQKYSIRLCSAQRCRAVFGSCRRRGPPG